MLPLELLRVSRRGDSVRPAYLDDLRAAEYIIDAYKPGLRLRDARERVREAPFDAKLARGLAHVLERSLSLEEVDKRLVTRVRVEVFKHASAQFPVVDPADRALVFEAVAGKLGLTPGEVERLFSKGFEDELEIADLPPLTPGELAARYNTALLQTLLFRCSELKVEMRGSGARVKGALRTLKGYGLMYTAEDAGGYVRLIVDGPVSIFKQTERYGTRLAKFVPLIFGFEDWRLEARVRLHGKTYTFIEEKNGAPSLAAGEVSSEEFDSLVEKEFYRQLSQLCRVEREPEALVVDGKVFIPDFRVGDLYIEVVGFWTPEYLHRKYDKLMKLGVPILVLVDEKLAVSSWKSLPHYVVTYRERPRIGDVYRFIRPFCHNSN